MSTKDVLTLEDAEKICREGREPYGFRKEMFPEGVHVSPDRSRYDSIVEAFYKHLGEPEIVELDMELRKYMKYKAISKPVFLQGYRYAFLHLERRTSFLLGKDGQAGGGGEIEGGEVKLARLYTY